MLAGAFLRGHAQWGFTLYNLRVLKTDNNIHRTNQPSWGQIYFPTNPFYNGPSLLGRLADVLAARAYQSFCASLTRRSIGDFSRPVYSRNTSSPGLLFYG